VPVLNTTAADIEAETQIKLLVPGPSHYGPLGQRNSKDPRLGKFSDRLMVTGVSNITSSVAKMIIERCSYDKYRQTVYNYGPYSVITATKFKSKASY